MSEVVVAGVFGAVFLGLSSWLSASRVRPKIKLGYWAIRGLAAPLRYALELGGADYEDVLYEQVCTECGVARALTRASCQSDGPHFSCDAWAAAKSTLPTPFPNLPYLLDPALGERPLTESKAILFHLARSLDLYGATEAERSAIDQAVMAAEDVRGPLVSACYSPDFAAKRPALEASLSAKARQLRQGAARTASHTHCAAGATGAAADRATRTRPHLGGV